MTLVVNICITPRIQTSNLERFPQSWHRWWSIDFVWSSLLFNGQSFFFFWLGVLKFGAPHQCGCTRFGLVWFISFNLSRTRQVRHIEGPEGPT